MRFMELPPLAPGFILVDHAPMGSGLSDWKPKPAPVDWNISTADIVADGEKIFGYKQSEFLSKQYK